MDCKNTATDNFKTKLGFNQHEMIMTKEQSVLRKVMKVFSSEKVLF